MRGEATGIQEKAGSQGIPNDLQALSVGCHGWHMNIGSKVIIHQNIIFAKMILLLQLSLSLLKFFQVIVTVVLMMKLKLLPWLCVRL